MKEFNRHEIESAVSCLKNIAGRQNWSQNQLAHESGVAQSTVSKIFSGESGTTPEILRKLCHALGVRLDDIMHNACEGTHDLFGYLATPLTGLTESMEAELQRAVLKIKDIAHNFNDPKIDLYWPGDYTHPLRNPEISPQQVYLTDRSRVSSHDFVVLFCAAPSYGVGQESEIATQVGVPAIRIIPSRFSRMMSGSFVRAFDVPFNGSLGCSVEIDCKKLQTAFENTRQIYFKHRALYRGMNSNSFGGRFTRFVHERSGGYARLAEELGIELSYLHVLMNEPISVSNPSAQLLRRMALLLGTTIGYLLGESEDTDPVWVESKASWRRWIDANPTIGASTAVQLEEEWLHEYRRLQGQQSTVSYRKPNHSLTESDWQKRYQQKTGKETANASGRLF